MKFAQWNGKTKVYREGCCYENFHELTQDFATFEDVPALWTATQVYLNELGEEDLYSDELPDTVDGLEELVTDEIWSAFLALNAAIKKARDEGKFICWELGDRIDPDCVKALYDAMKKERKE